MSMYLFLTQLLLTGEQTPPRINRTMLPFLPYLLLILLCYTALFGAATRPRGEDQGALFALIAAVTAIGNVISGKIVMIDGFAFNPASCMAVLLFWCGTLLTERSGLRAARTGLGVSFFTLLLLVATIQLCDALPGGVQPDFDHGINALAGFLPGVLGGCILAFGVSYGLMILAQSRWQRHQHQPLRNWQQALLLSGTTLLDTAIFSVVAYRERPELWGAIILSTWGMRLAVITIGIPVIARIRRRPAFQPSV